MYSTKKLNKVLNNANITAIFILQKQNAQQWKPYVICNNMIVQYVNITMIPISQGMYYSNTTGTYMYTVF